MTRWGLFFLLTSLNDPGLVHAASKLIFFDEARVMNDRVRMADLVDTRSLSDEEMRRLSAISIAKAPVDNSVLTLEERALAQLVRVHGLAEKFEGPLKIPSEIRVIGPEAAWNETNFRIHLRAFVHQPGTEAKIEGLRLPPLRPWMERARWSLDRTAVSNWKGAVSIPVKFLRRDGVEVTDWVAAHIRQMRSSPVSVKFLRAGQTIAKEDFAMELRDSSHSIDGSLDSSEMIGRRLKKSVPIGQIIWAGDFERTKLVERGQSVDLLLDQGGVRVKMAGIAQEDGGMGDRVRIQNPDSKKTVSAVVVGSAQAELR